jgi:predicted dehydrogenase/threonine dehydrogenase-like Zn-dependent dehydrogenase
MKQVLQALGTGATMLVEAPAPRLRPGTLLIETAATLISSGTERMLVDFGRSSLLNKARKQPDKVLQVLDKAKTDGLLTTVESIRSKLGQPIPLGYCNAGIVCESGAEGFQVGDRVASNGPHADLVCVSKNLCAKIPDNVSDEEASFTVLASIGLQGIRLAQPTLGECFVVIGAGLIGLLTVQMLRAQGCRVLAIDYDTSKLKLAADFGAEICNLSADEDPVSAGIAFSRGRGVDGVLITASTKSNDPITHAAKMSRKRGRIILVGVTGLELNRADFYEKELTFQVSCSYGPGRYDTSFEDRGHDYPIGFVRWTEQRNFEAVLDMMASGVLDIKRLISHRVPFENAPSAYELLTDDSSALGILLTYNHSTASRHIDTVRLKAAPTVANGKATLGVIGAGNYASRVLVPSLKAAGASLQSIVSSGGTSAAVHGQKLGFTSAAADADKIFSDQRIDAVIVATRHDSHAQLCIRALRAAKHVFVEKPLALSLGEVDELQAVYNDCPKHLMVGFNRRFAPQTQTMKRLMGSVNEPKTIIMVMNAGPIAANHWTQDSEQGGGRIIGEACHHIDLMRFLIGHPIVSVQARRIGNSNHLEITDDKAVIVLGFADGSFGTIHYLANGGGSFPKERVEVFTAGRTLRLDNFLKLRGFNWPGFRKQNLWRQDKGQMACAAAFVEAVVNGGEAPIPVEELFEVARVSIQASEMLRAQQ